MKDTSVSALVVVNVSASPPLLNTEQPLNKLAIVVTPVMSEKPNVWLNAAQPRNMFAMLARLFDVVHVSACPASSTVLLLLNNAQFKNMDNMVVTPVVSDATSVWLNAPQFANI